MLKYPEATPCPVLTTSTPISAYEATEELNLTSEIQAALRQVGPRRRRSILPQVRPDQNRLSPTGAGFAAVERQCPHERTESAALMDRAWNIGLCRASLLPSNRPGTSDTLMAMKDHPEDTDRQAMTQTRKKPRRRTIYVPSDDTSILTIHPGIQSRARDADDYSSRAIDRAGTGLTAGEIGQAQRARRQLTAAPRRGPLQPTLKPLQEMENQYVVAGTGPGKENVPPGTMASPGEKRHKIMGSRAKRLSMFGAVPERGKIIPDESPVLFPGQRSKPRIVPTVGRLEIRNHSSTKPATKREPQESMMNRRNSLYYGSTWKAPFELCHAEPAARMPSKLMAPRISNKTTVRKGSYSILPQRYVLFGGMTLSSQFVGQSKTCSRKFAHLVYP